MDDRLLFQVIDWHPCDAFVTYTNEYNTNVKEKKHVIKAFGRTEHGEPASVNFLGFDPYFYVRHPDKNFNPSPALAKKYASMIHDFIVQEFENSKFEWVQREYASEVIGVKKINKKEFYGFTSNKRYPYFLIKFKTMRAFKEASKVFQYNEMKVTSDSKLGINEPPISWVLYESNIDPFIRFLHYKHIMPSGWISIPLPERLDPKAPKNKKVKNVPEVFKNGYNRKDGEEDYYIHSEHIYPTDYDLDFNAEWQLAQAETVNKTAPFVVASFDIECTSANGDFPLAKKGFQLMVLQLYDMVQNLRKHNTEISIIKEHIEQAILSAFEKTPHNYVKPIYPKPGALVKADKVKTLLKNHLDDLYIFLCGKVEFAKKKKNGDADNEEDEDDEDNAIETQNRFLNQFRQKKPISKQDVIEQCTNLLNNILVVSRDRIDSPLEGDSIIQIGTTVHRVGERDCSDRYVVTLDTCDKIDGVTVITCDNEADVILKWIELMKDIDPDIVTGYNIFGFDWPYLYDRACELDIKDDMLTMGRIKRYGTMNSYKSKFCEKNLSSSALGNNTLYYVNMEGRVQIDMMKYVQRDHKLETYKLDHVAQTFINGVVKDVTKSFITLENILGLQKGDFITFGGAEEKYKIANIDPNTNRVKLDGVGIHDKDVIPLRNNAQQVWGLAKDDVSPSDIFKCQSGTSTDRARIAKYCVMDCAICNYLIIKLEVIANNCGMSNVCWVPLSYIFMRGQGVKIFSLVSKQCQEDGYVIPVVKKTINEEKYEGAIVLSPCPGIYVEQPVAVLDYSSLYPSSMISENISHDSIVLDPEFDNLPGISYLNIEYDVKDTITGTMVKQVDRYAQLADDQKSVLPRILMTLLSQRKATRKKMTSKRIRFTNERVMYGYLNKDNTKLVLESNNKTVDIDAASIVSIEPTYDEFQQAILDGLQLAYKVTANSLYGQVGASTSQICLKQLAASTTATGRNLILKAKAFIEDVCHGTVIYGDTDSVFATFPKTMYSDWDKLDKVGKVRETIDIAVRVEKDFKNHLKDPHTLEYEKTAYPFIIFSKKRYTYNKYDFDPEKFKQVNMGIALKRRGYANVVKTIYGGVLDILLNKQDIDQAMAFLKTRVADLLNGKVKFDDLVITKVLNAFYKIPHTIPQKVLADRMRHRDPGSAPRVNDRIPFVFVEVKAEKKTKDILQAERVEHTEFVKKEGLKPDYAFYIASQLENPCLQLFALPDVLEHINNGKTTKKQYEKRYMEIYQNALSRHPNNAEKAEESAKKSFSNERQHEARKLIFEDLVQKHELRRQGIVGFSEYMNKHNLQ